MTARAIIGIDPGLSGAIALMDADTGGLIALDNLPILIEGKKKIIDAVCLAGLIARYEPDAAIIEMVSARPTDSRQSAFTFGRNIGAIEALIMSAGIPMARVAPVTWRKAAGLPTGAGKDASIAAALRLHPSARQFLMGRQATHDRGDAVLIASWGARHG